MIPDDTEVRAALCRIAQRWLDPQQQMERPPEGACEIPESEGSYFFAVERLYNARIDELRRELYVSKRMEQIQERQIQIAETAIARLQGEIAALEGTIANLNDHCRNLMRRKPKPPVFKRGWFARWL